MLGKDDLRLRVSCLVRKLGLGKVPSRVLAVLAIACAALLAIALVRFWPTSSEQHEEFQVTAQEPVGQQESETSELVVDV